MHIIKSFISVFVFLISHIILVEMYSLSCQRLCQFDYETKKKAERERERETERERERERETELSLIHI